MQAQREATEELAFVQQHVGEHTVRSEHPEMLHSEVGELSDALHGSMMPTGRGKIVLQQNQK